MAATVRPDETDGYHRSMASQTWNFAREIRLGDLVIVPRDHGHTLALGRVTGECQRAPDGSDLPYVRSVDWLTTDIDANALADDFRNSLGSISTVWAPKAPGAAERIEMVAGGSPDPGPADYPVSGRVGAWVFQCDPRRFDLLDVIKTSPVGGWSMNQSRNRVSVGDRVWLRITGKAAGIYAVGRMASLPHHREEATEFGAWGVDVAFEAVVEPPLLQATVAGDPLLSKRPALKGIMGTNLVLDEEADEHLATILENSLRPVIFTFPESRLKEEAVNRSLDEHRQLVEAEIVDMFHKLKPDEFERLCAVILERMDFQVVDVVGASTIKKLGDEGVDIEARMSQRGLPSLRVRVQVKRQVANVGPDAIRGLRGSLKAAEQAIFMTASRFTKKAVDEANADGKTPVGLLDGSDLAHLLIELGIGVKSETLTMPRFDPGAVHALVLDE